MMSLADASSYFDETPVLDPDSGTVLFYGQVDPYDDSKRDAGAAYRRILSVAPGTIVPTSRTVRIMGRVWVVGEMQQDGLEEIHREKYVLQQASRWMISRLQGFLIGMSPAQVWASVEWDRDSKEIESTSEIAPQFIGIFGAGCDVRVNDIIWRSGERHLVRVVRPTASGYFGARLARIEYDLTTATVTLRTFSPVAGGYTSSAPVNWSCQRVRWQDFFAYGSEIAESYKPGDDVLLLPISAAVTTSSRIAAYGFNWQVLAVDTVDGLLAVHVRGA